MLLWGNQEHTVRLAGGGGTGGGGGGGGGWSHLSAQVPLGYGPEAPVVPALHLFKKLHQYLVGPARDGPQDLAADFRCSRAHRTSPRTWRRRRRADGRDWRGRCGWRRSDGCRRLQRPTPISVAGFRRAQGTGGLCVTGLTGGGGLPPHLLSQFAVEYLPSEQPVTAAEASTRFEL